MRILIVEDDDDILAILYAHLEKENAIVDSAGDGITGLHRAVTEEFDALILDINLPGMDGLTLCRRLRDDAANPVPILMLTSNADLDSKIEGFEAGADDYLVKPFEPDELWMRLRAITRRSKPTGERQLKVGDLSLDLSTLTAERGAHQFHLSPIAIRILELLMRESPNVVRRESIERHVWGDDPPDSDSLRAHIYALRSAIDKPFEQALLHTVPKVGYRLSAA